MNQASQLPRMRLHRYIAHCGYCSRRRAELLIEAGRVDVNRKVVRVVGSIVNPARDEVRINGEPITPPAPLTILFNKPPNVITSTHDTHNRLTVMDLLPKSILDRGVLPVGRLDLDTEGLLILTNDGDLSHRITHPSFETEKEYDATVASRPRQSDLERLEKGVRIEDGLTAPARILSVKPVGNATRIKVVIHEGKKRQVRRMFEVIGHIVSRLQRVRIGKLELGELKATEWRALSEEEIRGLIETGTGKRPAKDPPQEV